ncbi:Membrane-bound lytic murein transglycosylase D precursor [compost metagenome]
MKKSVWLLTILLSSQVACAGDEPLVTGKESPLAEDTPVVHTEIAGDKKLADSRTWRVPSYSGQGNALGYSPEAFAVPKGMEKQVGFWVDIYTKYTTQEGVIHDAEYIDLVYDSVDLRGITSDKAKQKKVDEVKKEIMVSLQKLADLKSPENLTSREQKIWDYFAKVDEPNKFKDASDKNRIRFQLGQKDRMQEAIFFSGRYIEDMEKIFREANLPIELTRMAYVESSFNIMARSKVGASGIWQIMPYTARPYKYISPTVDRRNHPLEATKLAAKLLAGNYRMLESWPLAVTGYNHGPTGVRRMTNSYKTREISELIQNVRSRKSFGFASRNFYASFLAALEVEKNAVKYFGEIAWSKPLESQDLKLPMAIGYKEVLRWFDGDDEKAQVFNPHITHVARKGRAIPAKTTIAVPKDKYDIVLIELAKKDRTVAAADKKADRKN